MEQKGNVAFTSEAGQVKKEQKVFNLIILDESGSMETIAEQAVSGLNETFQTISAAQKEHQEQKHFISFVTFNGIAIRTIMDRLPVDNGILKKWHDAGVQKPSDIIAAEEDFRMKNATAPAPKKAGTKKSSSAKIHNFTERQYDYDSLMKEIIPKEN